MKIKMVVHNGIRYRPEDAPKQAKPAEEPKAEKVEAPVRRKPATRSTAGKK